MTLWERMERVAETLERQANDYFAKSNASRFDADLQMRLYNHSCAYQNAANEVRNALQEHAMKEGAMEKQAEYGERKTLPKLCPLTCDSKGFYDCAGEDCAWWTGTECAVVAIAKRGRGIDVMIKPPAVPGL